MRTKFLLSDLYKIGSKYINKLIYYNNSAGLKYNYILKG